MANVVTATRPQLRRDSPGVRARFVLAREARPAADAPGATGGRARHPSAGAVALADRPGVRRLRRGGGGTPAPGLGHPGRPAPALGPAPLRAGAPSPHPPPAPPG